MDVDYSNLSNDQLDRLLEARKGEATGGSIDYNKLNDSDLDFLLNQARSNVEQKERSSVLSRMGQSALEVVGEVGQFIDTYTGAPMRAGIGAAQNGNNPIAAAYEQFGEDPALAPTGKQIAQKASVPDNSLSELVPGLFTNDDKEADQWLKFKVGGPADITASGFAGLGIDVAADPTNVIPGVAIAKGAKLGGKAAKSGLGLAAKLAGKTGETVANTASKVTTTLGNVLTGIPKKNIETYIKKRKAVDQIIAKHGGDMSLAADEIREGLQNSISAKISSLNNEIKTAIKEAPEGSYKSQDAIINAMEDVKSGINPDLYPESIAEINELIEKIKTLPPELSADAANEAKRFLQKKSKGSYLKNGQIFSSSKESQKAARRGAREARRIETELAPGTAQPNLELSKIHQYEKNVNKNLIAPGKTESAMMGAGSGANARNVKNLKDISDMTGYDALTKAEELSAAKAFADPGYLPIDATGKSATRMAVGAMTGSYLGGPIGTAIGILATSPMALKQAIKAGDISSDLIKKLAGGAKSITDDVIDKAVKASQTKEGQSIIRSFEKSAKSGSIQETNRVANEKKKGPEKWANDGLEKLLKKNPEKIESIKGALLNSKKGKKLLIAASSVSANSKAMDKILSQIDKEFGGKN